MRKRVNQLESLVRGGFCGILEAASALSEEFGISIHEAISKINKRANELK